VSLSRVDDIADRLPHFYLTWDGGTAVSAIVRAVAASLDDVEAGLIGILRAHWVDTATGTDLGRLGALLGVARKEGESDPDFRGRLKTAIIGYSGGGTPGSIRMMVRIALRLPEDYPVAIVENPPVRMKKTWKVGANGEWEVDPHSITPCRPEISLTVETPGVKITNPTLRNLDTGEAITFTGELSRGDVLTLNDRHAALNGKEATERLSTPTAIVLPRRKTRWQYTEAVGSNIGVFDRAQFDRSVYAVDIVTAVTFEWTASEPASFEVRVPRAALEGAGVGAEYVQGLLDSLKASGVKGVVKVV
jgi:hypothetical protein